RADREPLELVRGESPGGEDDHGDRRGARVLTEEAGQLEPVHMRHHHVGDHEVRRVLLNQLDRLFPVVGHADLISGRGQLDLEEPGDERIVVDDEQLLPARVGSAVSVAHVGWHILRHLPFGRLAGPPTHRQLTVPTWRGRGSGEKGRQHRYRGTMGASQHMKGPSTVQVLDSFLDAMGDTPLVRLRAVTRGLRPTVLAKLEMLNPGGSVKDRIGIRMIEAAEREGKLRPGGTIVEPTSGNTGHGLAIAAAVKGYDCIFVMPDKMSQEKIALLRAYGAEVVICPTAVPPDSPESYYSVSDRLAEEIPGGFKPDQYSNMANPDTHYEVTGPE